MHAVAEGRRDVALADPGLTDQQPWQLSRLSGALVRALGGRHPREGALVIRARLGKLEQYIVHVGSPGNLEPDLDRSHTRS